MEKELAESNAKLEKVSNSKIDVESNSNKTNLGHMKIGSSIPTKPSGSKGKNVHIPPFKRNHKEEIKTNFARLDKD